MSETYDSLAARAERGELAVIPGTTLHGAAAAEQARAALLEATGANDLTEAVQLAVGRPRAGAPKRGPSPVVRARVPQALKDRVHALAQAEGRDESDVVREALAAYIEARIAPAPSVAG